MANWISSKLKVAETLLQQIDQQAAESLRKNEKPPSDDQTLDTPTRSGTAVSLKDQLKKKRHETTEIYGKLQSDPTIDSLSGGGNSKRKVFNGRVKKETSKPSAEMNSKLTDSDWTELLSSPTQANLGTRTGVPTVRGLQKDGRRDRNLGTNLSALDRRSNQKNTSDLAKSPRISSTVLGNKLSGKPSDGEESSSSGRSSSVETPNDAKHSEAQDLDQKDTRDNPLKNSKNISNGEFGKKIQSKAFIKKLTESIGTADILEKKSDSGKTGELTAHDPLKNTAKGEVVSKTASQSSISDALKKRSSLTSDEESDSDSDSDSGSTDSEREQEREERRIRREKILAEKAAAKAVEVIKERENYVARLEGEKLSLEKILEERAKQQAQEASELQTTMMETMEATELEKQKHNNTRMEVFAQLAKLETSNVDFARSFATAQKKLELEINQVQELREQIESREVAHEDLRRRISSSHQNENNLNQQLATSRGVEFEREILEAEYSFLTDKTVLMQEKAKKLEENITMMKIEMEDPTEVEVELKRRLSQLTDHLIQKQAQVEALSSEKATLLFRIEAVSRLVDESKSMAMIDTSARDLEIGGYAVSGAKLRPLLEEKIGSGRKHLGSLVQQLDAIFLAGTVFLRRNPTAKIWSLIYIICLHLWVIYILCSHSETSNETKSGAVISLENINTTGV